MIYPTMDGAKADDNRAFLAFLTNRNIFHIFFCACIALLGNLKFRKHVTDRNGTCALLLNEDKKWCNLSGGRKHEKPDEVVIGSFEMY